MELSEYYIKEHYNSVADSLKLFQDDPLVHKPGINLYTSQYGFAEKSVSQKNGYHDSSVA